MPKQSNHDFTDLNDVACDRLDELLSLFFDDCLDDGFMSLGECTDSYCDNTSRRCEPTLANGETCDFDGQCTSGNCEVTSSGGPFVTRECADPSYCIGT